MKISDPHTIWNSYECRAWSMGFDYTKYVEHLTFYGYVHSPLSFDGYSMLCTLLDNSLEESCK